MRQTLRRQIIWEMHEANRENSDDLVSTYFVRSGNVTRIQNFFSNESLLHNLRHSYAKNTFDSWCHCWNIKN